jgi:GTPase SAR1 family protein
VADVLLRRRVGHGAPLEVRVAVVGNVDSGKSTMVGVLTRSLLDDGRGLARSKVFKHGHESDTGAQQRGAGGRRGAATSDKPRRAATCPSSNPSPAAASQMLPGHPLPAGRTSSIGQHNLCLDSKGEILNDSAFRCAPPPGVAGQGCVCVWGGGGG